MKNPVRAIEEFLQQRFEGTSALTGDVQPLDMVRQIEREIERNKKVFINDQTLVPHRLVVHLFAPTSAKVDEYEMLFNTPQFRQWVEGYIKARGYTLLDRLRIGIECHTEQHEEFHHKACFVEFSWPQISADPADYTVVLDPRDSSRILSAEPAVSQLPVEAWLAVLEGDAYESSVRIVHRVFNLGRSQHVLRRDGRTVGRVNHLAFRATDIAGTVNHSVSRRHARIVCEGDTLRLFDDGSQNGTAVIRGTSKLLVPKSTPAGEGVELQPEDVIVLGQARVRVGLQPSTR